MTQRILRVAVALGAAAAFLGAPSAHAVDPLICTHRPLLECLKEVLAIDIREICIPNGDLEDDCQWG